MIRIIGGNSRGKKLNVLEGETTRPTTDRVKESLFNILSFDLPGCSFLDMFAGSGAIGLEALSRGASYAAFAETDKRAAAVLKKNVASTQMRDNAEIFEMSASDALKKLKLLGRKFDMVYIDPPYKGADGGINPLYAQCMKMLEELELLNDDAKIMLEHSFEVQDEYGVYKRYRNKKYGLTEISFYEREKK